MPSFKRDTVAYLETLRESAQPLVLTVNGKPVAEVQDVACYQRLLEMVNQLKAFASIGQGLQEMKAGMELSAEEVLAEIRQKFQIPRAR